MVVATLPLTSVYVQLQNFAPMTFNELRDKLFENYESGAISDEELLQIIEIAKTYLNLKTITNTATIRCKSYNGIKEFSHPDIVIDKVKFYINND